jgi:hypothetical protein
MDVNFAFAASLLPPGAGKGRRAGRLDVDPRSFL